jgi:UDP-glucose 4-epimerase
MTVLVTGGAGYIVSHMVYAHVADEGRGFATTRLQYRNEGQQTAALQ